MFVVLKRVFTITTNFEFSTPYLPFETADFSR